MEYNNYITFSNNYGSVRVELDEDGKPWFFATDVARMLEGKADHVAYKMKKVADNEKKLVKRLVKSGVRNVHLVNLEGFTTLTAECKCHRERVEVISDLLISAWNQALGDECNEIYSTNPESNEENKAEEPVEAVEKPLEEVAEEKKVEKEKATVEEKQVINNLTTFQNAEFGEIRTELVDNEPWFCLADVCRALDIAQPSKVKERLNAKGVHTIHTLTAGGTQELLFVNESNFYKTVFQSRKENAERFTEWVTGDRKRDC